MKAAIWGLAFRPFFLFGAIHAIVVMLFWVGYLNGAFSSFGSFDPILWHSHEMVYGFTSAIVVGFVLTAAQNWTGKWGVHGAWLASVFGVWAAARILFLIPTSPEWLRALVDLAFYPYASILLVPYLSKDPELKAERFFFVFFSLLFVGNLLTHLQALGWLAGHGMFGIMLGLNTIILIIVFMGGRVIPFFTESSIARAQPKVRDWVEKATYLSTILFLLFDLFAPSFFIYPYLAFLAATTNGIRLSGWYVRRIRRIPLIWSLHLAYLWLVLGFLFSGLSAYSLIPKSLAIHAFTVGCIGLIIYAMISRVSLGHTGRRLHPSLATVIGYVLLSLSAIFRVLGVWAFQGQYRVMLSLSGVLWMLAFVIFVGVYLPILTLPRVDGRPG